MIGSSSIGSCFLRAARGMHKAFLGQHHVLQSARGREALLARELRQGDSRGERVLLPAQETAPVQGQGLYHGACNTSVRRHIAREPQLKTRCTRSGVPFQLQGVSRYHRSSQDLVCGFLLLRYSCHEPLDFIRRLALCVKARLDCPRNSSVHNRFLKSSAGFGVGPF